MDNPSSHRPAMHRLSLALRSKWKSCVVATPVSTSESLRLHKARSFRSSASLDALQAHARAAGERENPNSYLVLVEDFNVGGVDTCYLLNFIGPKGFAIELSRIIPRVIAFDHRKSTMARISQFRECPENLELRIYTSKCSARAVYDFFSEKLSEMNSSSGDSVSLLNQEDEDRVATVLRYLEDTDLRRWELPDIKAFNIGIKDERAKLNCVTNPHVFKQLLEIDAGDMIAKGYSYTCARQDDANKLLDKAFKIWLGRGLYGECLAIRADGNSDLSHEIGVELSRRSKAAGLRPIGAVVFMQRSNLKMCLRSTDRSTDTSEIAKVCQSEAVPLIIRSVQHTVPVQTNEPLAEMECLRSFKWIFSKGENKTVKQAMEKGAAADKVLESACLRSREQHPNC
ncbi:uncharacterized protein LOC103701218 isoform X3 [Phoenix dactylifera]|uniref:Uncharacterized protein LOC103701218 isoform X3 n=1 Tax=Phoenix dactylifera TaxID=42345 RepID=A0A8B8J1C2_PHODC|nr:uncharacterized protein LOC103701218 isoform X3 [Phoenix dactylifera]